MKTVLKTNDAVTISWLVAELAARGVEAVVLDSHASIVEGSLGILPRRVMVADEDYREAHQLLASARQDLGGL
ncbi:MAG: DUF2007 domain-containing protein [Alphaproteobacteria bacterium]|nr:DUF2007 domain-containing protein [Alphaproteobacteria bacterium]MCY4317647.1 DUF2007 domain-containing protein [Alphaproteobacteria bacterium]